MLFFVNFMFFVIMVVLFLLIQLSWMRLMNFLLLFFMIILLILIIFLYLKFHLLKFNFMRLFKISRSLDPLRGEVLESVNCALSCQDVKVIVSALKNKSVKFDDPVFISSQESILFNLQNLIPNE